MRIPFETDIMAVMDNEEGLALLREIRDLQKMHVENYKEAVRNQVEALALQQKANRFQRRSLAVLVLFLLAVFAAVYLPTFLHSK